MGVDASKPAADAAGGPTSMTEEEFRSRSISKMDSDMRKKYAQGAKYNFKVGGCSHSPTGVSDWLPGPYRLLSVVPCLFSFQTTPSLALPATDRTTPPNVADLAPVPK
jgi:hypothetical protein